MRTERSALAVSIKLEQLDDAFTRLTGDQLPSQNFIWRIEPTPYKIFLAEFLLVRTRADIVANYYEKIYTSFPNIHILANADLADVENALNPLGLKKRACWLIKAAKYIGSEYSGEIPNNINDLLKVPGIGKYVASAICAFSFHLPIIPTDVNIYRFTARIFGLQMTHPTRGSPEIREISSQLSKKFQSPKPEILIDFCRNVCKSRKPLCDICHFNKICDYRDSQIVKDK